MYLNNTRTGISNCEPLPLTPNCYPKQEGGAAGLWMNPLDSIRNTNTIRLVMKNGCLYDGDTLDEIYPRQVETNKQWWIDEPQSELPGVIGYEFYTWIRSRKLSVMTRIKFSGILAH